MKHFIDYKNLIEALNGKKLVKVEKTHNGDEGLKFYFDNDEFLDIAFSGDEGIIVFNELVVNEYLFEREK